MNDSLTKKKSLKKKKKNESYCICRRGYDGKEFMVACDGCQEWFHGACINVTPQSITDRYYCASCSKKKTLIIPVKKVTLPSPPVHQEEEDDICILCDGECTCDLTRPPTPPKQTVSSDEEIVVDDLIEAVSPLSHTPAENISDEEFFTDDEALQLSESDVESDVESEEDVDDEEEEVDDNCTFVEDNDEDEEIPNGYYYGHWSDDDDDDEEEEEEEENDEGENTYFKYAAIQPSDDAQVEDQIQSIMETLAKEGTLTSSSTSLQDEDLSRRPSLPSSALLAARRLRGSLDMSSSETVRTLSTIYPLIEEEMHDTMQDTSKPLDDGVLHKRKHGVTNEEEVDKKRRTSRSNSFSAFDAHRFQVLPLNSYSTPVSPTADLTQEEISMDDVLDTSKLYSLPEPEEDPYDLSRWQRIPIGAFRFMRSKNKLWLER